MLGGIALSYMDGDIFERYARRGLEMYVCRAHLQFYFCRSGMRKALGYGLKSFWVEILILVTSDREVVERKWLTEDERVKLFFMPLDPTSHFFLIQSYTPAHVCPIQKLYASQAVMAGDGLCVFRLSTRPIAINYIFLEGMFEILQ